MSADLLAAIEDLRAQAAAFRLEADKTTDPDRADNLRWAAEQADGTADDVERSRLFKAWLRGDANGPRS